MEEKSDSYNRLFKWLGYSSGRLYNLHKDWEKEPEWFKQTYRHEMELLGGDIDTPLSGAIKGMVEGTKNYAKKHKYDVTKMGREFANTAGISEEHGTAFAKEFAKTVVRK